MKFQDNIIVAYPGRFQPFGPHHYQVYLNLCNRFGKKNVYITTSGRVDEKSPLDFHEKRLVISKYGIPFANIVQTKSPYKPIELLCKFDENTTSLIICYGQKDYNRINFIRSDGSSSYYKKYYGQKELDSFSTSGYAYLTPNISIIKDGKEICGTYLREIAATLPLVEFEELFGWYDINIQNLFKRKFAKAISIDSIISNNRKHSTKMELKDKKYTKHIQHPYECIDLTWLDLNEFILETCVGNLPASPKYDGRNLQMTLKNGKVYASRNKGQIINPIDSSGISVISKIQHVSDAFYDAFIAVEKLIRTHCDSETFNSGKTFINFEIIVPPYNVYSYPTKMIVLHNLITYDELGNKVAIDEINFKYPPTIADYTVIDSKPIQLSRLVDWSLYKNFEFYLNALRLENRSNWNDSIEFLSESVRYKLQILILSVGNAIIQNNNIPYTDFQKNDINNIIIRLEKNIDDIYNSGDLSDISKLEHEIKRLDDLGGYGSINPIEGFVFNWKGRQLKLVGSFAPLNQILGMLRYKR